MSVLRCLLFLPALALLASAPLRAQSRSPLAAPGLRIPHGSLPFAVDRFDGKQELVPIHHSTIEVNNHKGANVAGSLAGSFFYKPKVSVELAGLHGRTALHDATPAIYVHLSEDTDSNGDSPTSNTSTWALVRATLNKDHRIFAKVQFTQLTGNAKRQDGVVDTTTEKMPGGWVKLTPTAPLTPGEYAIEPIPRNQNTFSTVVFDFTLDPTAPNATDAVLPDDAQ